MSEENLAVVVAFQGMQLVKLEQRMGEIESRMSVLESNLMNMAKGMDKNITTLKDVILDMQKKIQAIAENRVMAAGSIVVAPGQSIDEAIQAEADMRADESFREAHQQ